MSDAATSSLLEESQEILEQTEALLAEAGSATGKEAEALRARIASSLRDARERLGSAEKLAVEKARAAAKATDTYVRENPWTAVGVGAAVGVLIGMLIARR